MMDTKISGGAAAQKGAFRLAGAVAQSSLVAPSARPLKRLKAALGTTLASMHPCCPPEAHRTIGKAPLQEYVYPTQPRRYRRPL